MPRPSTLAWTCLLLAAAAGLGCSRAQYRRAADREVDCLVAEKSYDPRWALPGFTIEQDARSRYFNPYDPDHEPLPPDDPDSHRLMHCVDCKKGYPCWHADGDRPDLVNPGWREMLAEYAEVDEEGCVHLSLEDAMRLALVNSPSYQSQLETIYLSALDVSTERFRFDVQFLQSFSGNDTTFEHRGRRNPRGGEVNTLTNATDLRLRRRFATAGELMVGFANSFVWQFAGTNSYATASILDFALTQPLLRGAGRAVALEQLTIVERGLLANLRAFAQYRQGFYTQLAIGSLGVSGPQRRGGFFGGTGLTGFTGQGATGLGGVGAGFGRGGGGVGGGGGGGAAAFGGAGGGAGNVGGFLGLLQQLQEYRNSEANLAGLRRAKRMMDEFFAAGTIDVAQVLQVAQSEQTAEAQLLQAENALENSKDAFKTGTLGLPPDLCVELDDAFIEQFQFISPEQTELQNRLADAQVDFAEFVDEGKDDLLGGVLQFVEELPELARQRLDSLLGDMQRLQSLSSERKRGMTEDEKADFEEHLAMLARRVADRKAEFPDAGEPFDIEKIRQRDPMETNRMVEWLQSYAEWLEQLWIVQARVRVQSILQLDRLELEAPEALEIARANRLDWMNNRADLVNTWRLITFNANALKSDLNVTFSGDIRTLGNDPARFRAPTGGLRVGLEFDGPFNRLLERNNYRQALIDYQRDRRNLIQFEDGINQTLRGLLRQLEQLRQNLEIQRLAVDIATTRVDATREQLNEPPDPNNPSRNLTLALNLLTAIDALRDSQNNFMSVWLAHYATRMTLLRELGILEVDDHNLWIDPELKDADRATAEELPLPPEVPQEWHLDDADMRPLEELPPRPADVPPQAPKSPEHAPELPDGSPELQAPELLQQAPQLPDPALVLPPPRPDAEETSGFRVARPALQFRRVSTGGAPQVGRRQGETGVSTLRLRAGQAAARP